MPSLRVHRLSFAHSSSVPLFTGLDLHLAQGWIGLVGENGAGKTTLLRLLACEIAPDAGHVQIEPRGARAIVCPQSVERISPRIAAFAASSDASSRRIAGQLG